MIEDVNPNVFLKNVYLFCFGLCEVNAGTQSHASAVVLGVAVKHIRWALCLLFQVGS